MAAEEVPTDVLRRLLKTDPDPRVRQRAQAVLLVEHGHTLASVGRLLEMKPDRVRIWQRRYAAEGRTGLLDRSRRGRPPALDEAARVFVEVALEQGPQAYELPMTTWTLRDLQALLLRERGLRVSVCTLHRVVHALGYRYRRPRHDLHHRQDAQAVAAAKRVLDWLQKKPSCVRTIRC
jgi:transposase